VHVKPAQLYTVVDFGSLNSEPVEYFCFIWRFLEGARVSVVVKVLCYKPEGRGFDTR
jgi:hypothetical protein